MADTPSGPKGTSHNVGAGRSGSSKPAASGCDENGRFFLCSLILTSDETVRQTLTTLLGTLGAATVTSHSGPEGLERFLQVKPDLVVLDLGAWPAESLETLHSILQRDRQIPVILLIDHPNRELAIRGMEEGAYDFVEKPLDPRLLGFAMKRAMDQVRYSRAEQEHRRLLEETVEEQTSLVERKDFLQGILDSSTLVSVILTDLSQVVRFWNTGATNIFGYTAAEMLGQKITRIYPPDALAVEKVQELRDMVAKRSGTVHGKMKQITKDGRTVIISLALSPMLTASGELQGILGVGLDVTEEVHLHEELVKSYAQIRMVQDVSMFSLAKLAESRDKETGMHLSRMQEYCRCLALRLAERESHRELMTPEFIEDLVRSSVLHDIGKVGIPDNILLSPNRYTPEEFEIMKRHPVIGGDALEEAVTQLGQESYLSLARDIAYHHHERWDGSGYPFGLGNGKIPLCARIVALADVYDALTSARRYKPPYSHEQAVSMIVEGRGKHFDPELVDALLEAESEFRAIRRAFSEGDG